MQRAAPPGSLLLVEDEFILLVLNWVFCERWSEPPDPKKNPDEHWCVALAFDPKRKLFHWRDGSEPRAPKQIHWSSVERFLFGDAGGDLLSEIVRADEDE